MSHCTKLLAVAVTSAALGFLAAELAALCPASPAAAPKAAYPAPPPGCHLQAHRGSPAWYVTREPRPWQELELLPSERALSDPRWRGVVKVHSRATTPDTEPPRDLPCWRLAAGLLLVGDPAFLDEVADAVSRD